MDTGSSGADMKCFNRMQFCHFGAGKKTASSSEPTCLLCTHPVQNPRTLQCAHSFCTPCLESYHQTYQKGDPRRQQVMEIKCPTCQAPTPLFAGGLALLPSKVSKRPSQRICEKLLCKKARVEDGSQPPLVFLCRSHKKRAVSSFCRECQVPLCQDCKEAPHRLNQHQVVPFQELLAGSRESLHNCKTPLQTRMNEKKTRQAQLDALLGQHDQKHMRVRNSIDTYFNFLIARVERERQMMKATLEASQKALNDFYCQQKQCLEYEQRHLRKLHGFIEQVTSVGEELSMLMNYDDVRLKSQHMSQEKVEEKEVISAFTSTCRFEESSLPSVLLGKLVHDVLHVPELSTFENRPSLAQSDAGVTHLDSTSDLAESYKSSSSEGAASDCLALMEKCVPMWEAAPRAGEAWPKPQDVTFLPDGSLAVSDHSSSGLKIDMYSDNGALQDPLGQGNIIPCGITMLPDGKMAVADCKQFIVKLLTTDGQITKLKEHFFKSPSGIAAFPDGKLVVSDTMLHRVSILSPEGKLLTSIGHPKGHPGSANEEFHVPEYVAVNKYTKEILVSDKFNNCVKVFSEDGKFLRKFGCPGSGDGSLEQPAGICVDPFANIVVCSGAAHKVKLYNHTGVFMRDLLTADSMFNDMPLQWPSGVAVSENGFLAVTQSASGASIVKVYQAYRIY